MGVYYTEIDLPTGTALAAATEDGITRLELAPASLDAWLAGLAAEFGAGPSRDGGPFRVLIDELSAYFGGRAKRFTVALDVWGTPFQERVWKALMDIPYGRVVTYGALAGALGDPKAARAVGGALNKNRVPIIIPCHRVVASGGKIGGYGCGTGIKKALLDLEGVVPPYLPR